MVVNTARKSKSKPKAGRRFGVAVLASCIGAGTILAAAPSAFALDGQDTKSANFNANVSISKTDAETGAPLSGAVFRVEVRNPSKFYVAPFGFYDLVDPSTWTFGSAADVPYMTTDEFVQYKVDRHNAALTPYQSEIDALVAQVLDASTIAAHEATVAEWQAAVDAAAPFNAASAAANAERQRLADEIIALQDAGQPVPVELAQAHADAQAAQDAALAAAAPYNDAVDALAGGAQVARAALDASTAAQSELNTRFPTGYTAWTLTDNAVDTAAFEASMPAWIAEGDALRAAGLAQAECNAQWGVSTAPTDLGGGVYQYDIATCDGVATLPIGSTPVAITEIAAPEGYVLDGTRYETPRVSEVGFIFNGGEFTTRDGVLPVTNQAEPPVDPPVDPPVEPPVEPPVTPEEPKTPEQPKAEELAYTGSDTNVGALAGIAGLLALAGGALFAFRRRTASE